MIKTSGVSSVKVLSQFISWWSVVPSKSDATQPLKGVVESGEGSRKGFGRTDYLAAILWPAGGELPVFPRQCSGSRID